MLQSIIWVVEELLQPTHYDNTFLLIYSATHVTQSQSNITNCVVQPSTATMTMHIFEEWYTSQSCVIVCDVQSIIVNITQSQSIIIDCDTQLPWLNIENKVTTSQLIAIDCDVQSAGQTWLDILKNEEQFTNIATDHVWFWWTTNPRDEQLQSIVHITHACR